MARGWILMIAIDWDSRTPTASPDGFTLTLKTGVSFGLQNRLMALTLPLSVDALPPGYLVRKRPSTMRDPYDWHRRIAVIDEARFIVADLTNLKAELVKMDRPTYDAVPELILYSRKTARGVLRVCVVWGMVLNGSVSRGQRVGEWYFVLCLLSELSDVLDEIFKLERWFEQEKPKRSEMPKRKEKSAPQPDAINRAAMDKVLREVGLVTGR